MKQFTGKKAIVTGGASGIGRRVVERLLAEGARVACVDQDRRALEGLAAEVGVAVRVADVGDAVGLRDAFEELAHELGGLDLLFANAGVGSLMPIEDYPGDEIQRLVSVNFLGCYHALSAAVPLMPASGGAVVMNSSANGFSPTRGEAPYAAAKAAVISLVKSAALELGPRLRVNGVAPGFIQTPLTEPFLALEGTEQRIVGATPLDRLGTSEDVADVVLFLLSERAAFVTGQTLVVDGGLGLVGAGIDEALSRALDHVRSLFS